MFAPNVFTLGIMIMRTIKAILLYILTIIFILSSAGCSSLSTSAAGTTLWVLTEESTTDGMNLQIQTVIERIEEAYEGLTIQLEILPLDEEARSIRLKQIRTRIMAGNGPDVYLLPTGSTVLTSSGNQVIVNNITPLFSDVAESMSLGIFTDIQSFYEADDALNTEALNRTVMDAGVLDGKRYILPLRYDIPVIYTYTSLWEDFGLDQEVMEAGIAALVATALAQEDPAHAAGGIDMPEDLSLLPRLFDYEREEILVTVQDIADYMRLYQAWTFAAHGLIAQGRALIYEAALSDTRVVNAAETAERLYYPTGIRNVGNKNFLDIDSLDYFINYGFSWREEGYPLFTNSIVTSIDNAMIAKYAQFYGRENYELSMLPLRTTDGSVAATVTYFGAVGSSCDVPELAYAFLREFLTEEFQWDIYRPRVEKPLPIPLILNFHECQTLGLVENSWPVRSLGSAEYLWDLRQYQAYSTGGTTRGYDTGGNSSYNRASWFQRVDATLTDAELPVLSWTIDEVRFPVILAEEDSLANALSLLNDADGNPTDADIDSLAKQLWTNLLRHLNER